MRDMGTHFNKLMLQLQTTSRPWIHESYVLLMEFAARLFHTCMRRTAGGAEAERDRENEDEIFCTCRAVWDDDDGDAEDPIQCDTCPRWFHPSCVLGRAQSPEEVASLKYVCAHCQIAEAVGEGFVCNGMHPASTDIIPSGEYDARVHNPAAVSPRVDTMLYDHDFRRLFRVEGSMELSENPQWNIHFPHFSEVEGTFFLLLFFTVSFFLC